MATHADRQSEPAVQPLVTADGLLTVKQAAEFLQLGRNSIYNAMAAGQLPFCMFGRSRRIPRLALIEFAAARMTGGWAIQPHTPRVDESQEVGGLRVASSCCQSVARIQGAKTE